MCRTGYIELNDPAASLILYFLIHTNLDDDRRYAPYLLEVSNDVIKHSLPDATNELEEIRFVNEVISDDVVAERLCAWLERQLQLPPYGGKAAFSAILDPFIFLFPLSARIQRAVASKYMSTLVVQITKTCQHWLCMVEDDEWRYQSLPSVLLVMLCVFIRVSIDLCEANLRNRRMINNPITQNVFARVLVERVKTLNLVRFIAPLLVFAIQGNENDLLCQSLYSVVDKSLPESTKRALH